MEPLRADQGAVGELVRAVLDYRHHTKALSAFLEPYAQLCARGDGRVRPTIYTLAADTGRMSCVRLNLQQVPREGGFRACITADPGHVLISADFSGVEIRGAAALSQDATLIKLIAEEDAGRSDGLHWLIARQVFGPDATEADADEATAELVACMRGNLHGVPIMAEASAPSFAWADSV